MKILVLSPDYPDERRVKFAFVKQLVDELAKQGHHIQIVAPYSLTHNRRFPKRKEIQILGKGTITIYRPSYLSFSNVQIGSFNLTDWGIKYAFQKGLRMVDEEPDAVYGHFWTSAYQGFQYAKKHLKPLFVATGESEINFVRDTEDKIAFCEYVSGVVCVSTKNQTESVNLSLTTTEKTRVIPNAIDSKLFRKLNKKDCRERLGLPQDVFIVAFVGWFNERKGSERLSMAIKMVDSGETIYSLFIGEGQREPTCENILYKGRLAHEKIPEFLNAADVFALPTLQEGCCNAVIEAMACGLPVISSNLPFNLDVLDETNSIMINPTSVEELSKAIKTIRDDKELRGRLSEGALKRARSLTIDNRAAAIVNFLESKIKPFL